MNYIVFDLEWNQPTSFNTPVFRQIGDSLLFEVIQIGAVKLDEQFRLLEEVSIPIRPTHYTSIHPRVKRMTHLGHEQLCDAPAFPEAMADFLQWCGEDFVFLTWGGDDVSVLKQNIDSQKLVLQLLQPAQSAPLAEGIARWAQWFLAYQGKR